jgi:hypothetical protein
VDDTPGPVVVIVVVGTDAGVVDVVVVVALVARVVVVAEAWAVVFVLFGLAPSAADGVSNTAAVTIVAVVASLMSG